VRDFRKREIRPLDIFAEIIYDQFVFLIKLYPKKGKVKQFEG